tara:strand:- start:968 stop:1558 length:591 start_codon:yes stop_codon:yes gene_type:complete
MGILDKLNTRARMAAKATALIPRRLPLGMKIAKDWLQHAAEQIDNLTPEDVEVLGRAFAIPARVTCNAIASAANSAATQLRNVDVVAEIKGNLSDEQWAETQERLGIDVEEIEEMVGSGMLGDPRSCISHNALVGGLVKWTSLRNFVQDALEAASEIEQGAEAEYGESEPLRKAAREDDDNGEGDHTPPTFGSYFS